MKPIICYILSNALFVDRYELIFVQFFPDVQWKYNNVHYVLLLRHLCVKCRKLNEMATCRTCFWLRLDMFYRLFKKLTPVGTVGVPPFGTVIVDVRGVSGAH